MPPPPSSKNGRSTNPRAANKRLAGLPALKAHLRSDHGYTLWNCASTTNVISYPNYRDMRQDVIPTLGYPPLQSQLTYDLFNKVLSSPPKIVMRSRARQNTLQTGRHNMHAVLVPTVHFYFETDDDNGDGNRKYSSDRGRSGKGGVDGGSTSDVGKKCNSAFHRILLYAVCQFHGLESTSSTIQPNWKRRSGQHNSGKRGVTTKVVTVQGGWLLAPSFKMLDACMSVEG